MGNEELVHELAQPLQVIRLLSARLSKQPEAMVQQTAIQILEQVGRITHIVRHTRAPQRTPTDLNALIREAVDLVILTHRPHDIDLEVDLAETCVLNIDRVQIEQVLVNLVRNAFEAMQTNHGDRLIVRSGFKEGHVEVQVIDNGPGIDAAVMQRLFCSYTTSKPCGSGIGLAISQDIVHAHAGRMTVTTGDTGTCFVITLPY